jgi:hypothetical protein
MNREDEIVNRVEQGAAVVLVRTEPAIPHPSTRNQ